MSWNLSRATYIKKDDAVSEHRLKSGMDHDTAILELNKRKNQPVYAWEDNCSELENPMIGIVETMAYRQEYYKIQKD